MGKYTFPLIILTLLMVSQSLLFAMTRINPLAMDEKNRTPLHRAVLEEDQGCMNEELKKICT
jgi:hypothetical protein